MQRVEKHIVLKNKYNYKQIDSLSFACKNLYNKATYVVRQKFIETSLLVKEGKLEHAEWVRYYDLDKLAKKENWPEYKELPAQTAQQVLMLLEKNWKSFFASIKTFKTSGCSGKPKLPKYKHKTKGRSSIIFTKQQISLKQNLIKFPKKTNLQPIKTKQKNINQIRIVPTATCYVIEVVYEKEVNLNENLNNELFVGIDLGLNNLTTITSNKIGMSPILVNGRVLKSINQYYNKEKAKLQAFVGVGTSNRIIKLLHKRNNKIQNYLHHASRFVINHCLENNIGTIVTGKNDNWKSGINIGKRNNQNFVSIPFQTLIQQIEYKSEEVGIRTILNEESYTSKASFLDQDFIPVHGNNKEKHVFSGQRIKRGLYRSKLGKLINADVNGSYNILRKAIPKLFSDGIEGLGLGPIKINFNKVF